VASHTGSLAGRDEVFDAACRQFGLVRASDLENLYDKAKALSTLRPPRGNRLLVVSTSGGGNTLAADEAEAQGLVMPPLPPAYVDKLKTMGLPPNAGLANPLDLADIAAEPFVQAIRMADELDVADTYLICFGDPVEGAAEAVKSIATSIDASLAVAYFGGGEVGRESSVEIQAAGIPLFATPERAVRGIAAAVRDAEYRRSRRRDWNCGIPMTAGAGTNVGLVPEPEAIHVLQKYGIPYPAHGVARSPEEAIQIAARVGYPVVLKVVSPDIVHKSDIGGVIVGLGDADQVRAGFEGLSTRLSATASGARIKGVLVCQQAPAGLEVIVGALDDPTFGPTIMFGLGGIFAEVLNDVSFRIAPLERRDAEEMIREIRGYPLLAGARGQIDLDVGALVKLLMGVSQLVTDRGEIRELDLNPVRLYEQGLLVLDARMLVKTAVPAKPKEVLA